MLSISISDILFHHVMHYRACIHYFYGLLYFNRIRSGNLKNVGTA